MNMYLTEHSARCKNM